MRGQLPIIIALIILIGLIISSLFYITATTTYTKSLSRGPVKNTWDIIDQELDTLNLVALKYASHKAYEVFKETFHTSYREVNYTLVLEKRTAKYIFDFSKNTPKEINETLGFINAKHNISGGALILNFTGDEFPYAVAYIKNEIKGNVYIAFRGTAKNFIGWFQLELLKTQGILRKRSKNVVLEAYILGENKTSKKLEAHHYPLDPQPTYKSSVNNSYVYFGSYNSNSNEFVLEVYDAQSNDWGNLTYTGTDLGILKNPYYGVGGRSVVKIYKLLLSDRGDLKYVYVSGLEPGWRAVVTNGSISYEGVADSKGVAKIFFPDLIFWNGTVEVYDEGGDLVLSENISPIIGGDHYSLNFTYNYTWALANFTHALNVSCEKALGVLKENVLRVVHNWIYYKVLDGYSAKIIDFKPFYNVYFHTCNCTGGRCNTSIGNGSVGFYIKYFIIAPDGEWREFVKSINASYIMVFIHGYPIGFNNMTLIFRLKAMLSINGREYSYMEPNTLVGIKIYSILFRIMPVFHISSSGRRYIDLGADKTFYGGEGFIQAYYRLKYGYGIGIGVEDLYNDTVEILVGKYGFPDEYYFLWATISSIDIDGVKVPSAVKLVYAYKLIYQGSNPRGLAIGIWGDENCQEYLYYERQIGPTPK